MMSRRFFAAAAVLALSATAAWADAKDDLQAAVKKLGDAPSYSFTSTTDNQGGPGGGATTGKAEKGGYATLSVPAFAFGGDAPPPIEVVMKGDKTVVKMADGWKTTVELATAADAATAAGGGGAGGFNFGPEQSALIAVANVALPAATAKDATAKLENVKKTDDGFSGDLSADAVKAMLAFRGFGAGAPAVEISGPKGSIKVTVKDGSITKMVLQLSGSMDFGGGQPFDLNRTTTVEIKDVGTTKVTVPEDAKKKLDAPAAAPAPRPAGPATRPAG